MIYPDIKILHIISYLLHLEVLPPPLLVFCVSPETLRGICSD